MLKYWPPRMQKGLNMLGGLIQIYEKPYRASPRQIRIWRTRIYLERIRGVRWWVLGFEVNANGGMPMVRLDLAAVEIRVLLWSHRDDCDCDTCIPF